MSGPIGSQQWMYNASSGFYPYELNNSLKFEDGDSSYLSRTPSSAGNQKVFTFSCWLKLGNLIDVTLFGAGTGSDDRTDISLSDSAIFVQNEVSNDRDMKKTTRLLRDPSSWYHIVVAIDLAASSNSDKVKIYINGVQETSFAIDNTFANVNSYINGTSSTHYIGRNRAGSNLLDGYLAEVNFIDGLQLTPSSFGETKEGIWVPKEPTGLTYGTNGFRLPFTETTTANGFNTVLATGNASTQSLAGVGFQPDMVWMKVRGSAVNHILYDSVRGVQNYLVPNLTDAEATNAQGLTSFDSDGFTLGSINPNSSASYDFVAWCWDAGTGNAASNTDGTITSSVKANQDYGFSIATYTGTGSAATFGHGLSSAPTMVIVKRRDGTPSWQVFHTANGAGKSIELDGTGAAGATTSVWNNTVPSSTVVNIGTHGGTNTSSGTYVAYSFADVTGYQKIGTYTGTGSAGNAITTGFKPAWVMIKRTDSANSWFIVDATRDTSDIRESILFADLSDAEADGGATSSLDFTSTGFETNGAGGSINASGGTYIYLAIADTRDALFTSDASGNGNNWDANDLQHSDVMPDTPTDGFATLNVIDKATITLSEGNLKAVGAADYQAIKGTIALPSTGKYYWEIIFGTNSANVQDQFVGIGGDEVVLSGTSPYAQSDTPTVVFAGSGSINKNGSADQSSLASIASGDIVSVAVDMDGGTIQFYKNNSTLGTSVTLPTTTEDLFPFFVTTNTRFTVFNFGQDSSFNATKVPQGNADGNGKGDFFYAPPSGYLALCNANLPDPAIDPNAGKAPEDYFNTVLYTGDGSTKSITGVGFQPDFVWQKGRNVTYNHLLFDSVRGATKYLRSNATNVETTEANSLQSFDADGFTVGNNPSGSDMSNSSVNYVNWNWKAGGTGVTNTDGSIQSTVSVNTDAGFSIVTYTGNGSDGATVGHGLSQTPEFILIKKRDNNSGGNTGNWIAQHIGLATDPEATSSTFTLSSYTDGAIYLNLGNAQSSYGFDNQVNGNTDTFVAYCFHSVAGYSKFSSYTGNGSTDGPFIYTGFRPAFVIIKNASATEAWHLIDSERSPHNVANAVLYPSSNAAESNPLTAANTDFLSNGFKLRAAGGNTNDSGLTYIYMAFAEQPFKYSNAR